MDLNYNSWYAKWYRFVYITENMPNTLCKLGWGLLFSLPYFILTNPMWLGAYLLKKFKVYKNIDYTVFFIPLVFNIIMIIGSALSKEGFSLMPVLLAWANILTIVVICFGALFLVGYLLVLLSSMKSPKYLIPHFIKDIKQKTCTIIKWK